MNTRIRELAEQATTYIDPSANDGVCWDFDKEKFAELIVQECMTICKKHPSRDLDNLWSADAVAPDLVHQFEEYFGVEE